MKKIFLGLIAMCMCVSLNAQTLGYSSDAMVVSTGTNTVTVKSSGVHEKKKDAEITAVKSVFYTYLMVGLQGLNDDRPLIAANKQNDPKVTSLVNSIMNGQYNIYVKSYVADEKVDRTLDKMYKVTVTVEMYNEAFLKFLTSNSVIAKADDKISLRETDDNMMMPSMMIVPRVTGSETIKGVLDTKREYRSTISAMAQELLKEGVQTKSFDEVYNGIVMSGALASSMSSDDKILSEVSKGVDVVVYMDIISSTSTAGTSVEMILSAIDVSTRQTLATISEASNKFKGATVSNLAGILTKAVAPELVKQVATAFGRIQRKGQGISIRVELDKSSSADIDSEVTSEGLSVGDIMRLWVKENCKHGYRLATQTPTLLIYDEILINTQDESGAFSNVNDFELPLRLYLRKNGVTISKRLVDGNSIIYTLLL